MAWSDAARAAALEARRAHAKGKRSKLELKAKRESDAFYKKNYPNPAKITGSSWVNRTLVYHVGGAYTSARSYHEQYGRAAARKQGYGYATKMRSK